MTMLFNSRPMMTLISIFKSNWFKIFFFFFFFFFFSNDYFLFDCPVSTSVKKGVNKIKRGTARARDRRVKVALMSLDDVFQCAWVAIILLFHSSFNLVFFNTFDMISVCYSPPRCFLREDKNSVSILFNTRQVLRREENKNPPCPQFPWLHFLISKFNCAYVLCTFCMIMFMYRTNRRFAKTLIILAIQIDEADEKQKSLLKNTKKKIGISSPKQTLNNDFFFIFSSLMCHVQSLILLSFFLLFIVNIVNINKISMYD